MGCLPPLRRCWVSRNRPKLVAGVRSLESSEVELGTYEPSCAEDALRAPGVRSCDTNHQGDTRAARDRLSMP